MLGVTYSHFPLQGEDWNIWYIAIPFVVSVAMFSYSVHSMTNGRYRLLSTLALLTSGPVAFVEGIGASVLILCGGTY